MQNLLWIGGRYFFDELVSCGWSDARYVDFDPERAYEWEDVKRLAGFEPDVVVVADTSRPPLVLGVENFPCLTVFYSVDVHIHSWHPSYAQAFDACLVSLKDKTPLFKGPGLDSSRIWWSPPFAKTADMPDPGAEKKWDCLFVGTLNENLMPKRSRFLGELGKRVPGLRLESGDYRRLFPGGRVLVNQAERDDLNFRVFEAMGCGGCLVTPRVGHGLESLFVDGEHLVFYAPDDAGDAAYKINFLLAHPEIAEYIGRTALEEIDARHRAVHRAQAFTDAINDLYIAGASEIVATRKKKADFVRERCLAFPYLLWANEISSPELKAAYLRAAHKR